MGFLQRFPKGLTFLRASSQQEDGPLEEAFLKAIQEPRAGNQIRFFPRQ